MTGHDGCPRVGGRTVWSMRSEGQTATQRLVQVAANALSHPSGSLPEQTADAADLKAAYRLFGCEDVTFEDIVGPHWAQTRRRPPGVYLVLNDTTEVDFGVRRKIRGMGQTGNGGGWGFLLHSALVVSGEGEEIFGLAGQKIRYRKPAPKKENSTQRLKRDRESVLWGQVIDQVGPPAEGVRWVHVMDRGADNFEVYCHCRQQQADWVVRVTQKQRGAIVPDGQTMTLKAVPADIAFLRELRVAVAGTGGTTQTRPQAGAESAAGADGEGGGSLRAAEDTVSQAKKSIREGIAPGPDRDVGGSCGRSRSTQGRGAGGMDLAHVAAGGQFRRCVADSGVLREAVADRRISQGVEDGLPGGEPAIAEQGGIGKDHGLVERGRRPLAAIEVRSPHESRLPGSQLGSAALDQDALGGAEDIETHGSNDHPRVLPRSGQAGRFPRAKVGRRAGLDHHLARLAKVVYVHPWCGTGTNNQ